MSGGSLKGQVYLQPTLKPTHEFNFRDQPSYHVIPRLREESREPLNNWVHAT